MEKETKKIGQTDLPEKYWTCYCYESGKRKEKYLHLGCPKNKEKKEGKSLL